LISPEAHVAPPIGQADLLALLSHLRPHRAENVPKARFGSANDGGYVLLDDLSRPVRALSFGVEANDDWELALAHRGIEVGQYDDSIDAAPSSHQNLQFHRLRIAPSASDGHATLQDLLTPPPFDVILKMDIEGLEWEVLDATDSSSLARCRQLCVEFHTLSKLVEPLFYRRAARVFEKLAHTHGVIHVHGNNFSPLVVVENIALPDVIEITFAARQRYALTDTDELFPGPLDAPNNPKRPDIRLGSFRF
jgi:hypothetical protein